MKTFTLCLLAAAMAATFSACDNRPDIQGAWQGSMRTNLPGESAETTISYDFGKDGSMQATYIVNISQPLPATDSIMAAYQIDATATATINGTWQYVEREDDEVAINFDPATLKVEIDPEGVKLQSNLITAEQDPELEKLTPAAIKHYETVITEALQRRPQRIVLDDVKVKLPILKFEINDVDYVMHRN